MLKNLVKISKYSRGVVLPSFILKLWGCKSVKLEVTHDKIIITKGE